MTKIDGLISTLQKVQDSIPDWTRESLEANRGELMQIQHGQLMNGQASSGENLRPYYSEDPYFISRAQMEWYRKWKWQITPSPYRQYDVPNLYITGKFHGELDIYFTSDTVTIKGATPYAEGIVEKYGLESFGLTNENWQSVIQERILPYVLSKMHRLI